MNTKGYQKKKIQDFDNSNFGNYSEDTGGGTPVQADGQGTQDSTKKGGKGRGAMTRAKVSRNSSQPRTEDGKFTYNSVNGKGIKEKKSRGNTVNPLLTGGKNGVKIEDVEENFASQSGEYWDKYKDKWYTGGGEIVTSEGKTRVAAEPIWITAHKKYNVKGGEFEGESSVFDEVKRGRKSGDEKIATQLAQATGQEQNVIDSISNAIKMKPGATFTPGFVPYVPKHRGKYRKVTGPIPSAQQVRQTVLGPTTPTPAPTQPQSGQAGFLKRPVSPSMSAPSGISPSGMAAIQKLFGGAAPSNVTGTGGAAQPSLQGFKNWRKNSL